LLEATSTVSESIQRVVATFRAVQAEAPGVASLIARVVPILRAEATGQAALLFKFTPRLEATADTTADISAWKVIPSQELEATEAADATITYRVFAFRVAGATVEGQAGLSSPSIPVAIGTNVSPLYLDVAPPFLEPLPRIRPVPTRLIARGRAECVSPLSEVEAWGHTSRPPLVLEGIAVSPDSRLDGSLRASVRLAGSAISGRSVTYGKAIADDVLELLGFKL